MFSKDKRRCFTFTWTIENISYYWKQTCEVIKSPKFVINALQDSKYKVILNPGGIMDDDYVRFYLENQGCFPFSKIDCELEFLSKDGSVLTSMKLENCGGKIPASLQVKKEVYFLNLHEDKLTTRCKIWVTRDGDMPEDVQCFARTRICIEKKSFSWDIHNFSSLHRKEKRVCQIRSLLDNEVLMSLFLSLENPYIDEDSINIQLVSKNGKIKYLILHLAPVNGFGSENKSTRNEFSFHENKKPKLLTLPFSKRDLMANKDLCLPNDVLSFLCECTFSTGKMFEEIENVIYGCGTLSTISESDQRLLDSETKSSVSKLTLNENLKSLLHDNFLSDIKLITRDETFLAHKNILSARSPAFKAIIENKMNEKFDECVYIGDLDSDTVHRMLQYVYTADIEGLQWENACKLYRAADKYEILALRGECSAYLKSNLWPNNACEALILADAHRDEDLKASVQDFIFKSDVVNSAEWKRLMQTHLKLAAETMHLQIERKTLEFPDKKSSMIDPGLADDSPKECPAKFERLCVDTYACTNTYIYYFFLLIVAYILLLFRSE